MPDFLAANRANWNDRADIHIEDVTGFYAIDSFLAGEDVLTPIEAGEIGDVAGLKVLHLQCHIGLDTLCLARRGARVTGIDFSPHAIRHARMLAAKVDLDVRFIEGNVFDAPALVAHDFDMVYTTWGTTVWLPDIWRWAEVVAAVLKPGGQLYYADTHPSFAVLEEVDGKLEPRFDFRTPADTPLKFNDGQTYTGDPRKLENATAFEWIHPLGDLLMALVRSGMRIEHVAEHETLPHRQLSMMVRGEDRLYRLPAGVPRLPLSLSIRATKAG
ncbi:methyltransferase domain-containing protein [Bauldia sp.]|uniref:methyltransferase domain-containing protein n=1 Tax=Bauldia sp. TaxID=2575872 RepID=UPI003BA89523